VDDRCARANDPDPLILKRVKDQLIDHVTSTGEIEQRVEERHRWKDGFDDWYRAVIPIEDVPKP
jgi:hypothetical protein